ncbi:MAG: serine hydrolase [Calothrix sp. MO_192.B10]|nr:serine hydrolase [Calothrix sp. MO_192.B10]
MAIKYPQKYSTSNGRIIRKTRKSQLSHWQFYSLIILVILSILSLFSISSFFLKKAIYEKTQVENSSQVADSQPVDNSVNNSEKLPENNNPKTINQTADVTGNPEIKVVQVPPPVTVTANNLAQVYNVTNPPQLNKSKQLDVIINKLITYAKKHKLPTEKLSITLIDLQNHTISGHRQGQPRYPASVVKMFWMVALNAQIKAGIIPFNGEVNADLNKMMLKSDNNAGSRILDRITGTKSSSKKLSNTELQAWKKRREKINTFFEQANYKNINISQKTFPITDLDITSPVGPDLQIRGDRKNPQRNKITTYQTARLMYEIVSSQAVAPEYGESMLGLLTRDIRPEVWQKIPPNPIDFNPIESFFGQSLSPDKVGFFASKAGWTSFSRQEVAFVVTKDRKTRYILSIFGDHPAYAKSKKIFPDMSRLVFNQMTTLHQN